MMAIISVPYSPYQACTQHSRSSFVIFFIINIETAAAAVDPFPHVKNTETNPVTRMVVGNNSKPKNEQFRLHFGDIATIAGGKHGQPRSLGLRLRCHCHEWFVMIRLRVPFLLIRLAKRRSLLLKVQGGSLALTGHTLGNVASTAVFTKRRQHVGTSG